MIALFLDDGTPGRTRNALSYNGLTLNQAIGGSLKDIIEVNRAMEQTAFSAVTERREFQDGMEAYPTYKAQKRVMLSGMVRASSRAALHDRIEELAAAFDPALVSRDNPDDPFLALDFSVPTADTTNYPTGLIACRYYLRSEAAIEPPISQYGGLAVPFVASLIAVDPRRYTQATESLTGAGVADNGKADYWSWPTLTIAMSGAGNAAFEIANAANAKSLVLDLSGRVNGDSVAVDMENASITVGGVDAPELYVSGDFFGMEPGSNNITLTNDTNASPTLVWRPAFSA